MPDDIEDTPRPQGEHAAPDPGEPTELPRSAKRRTQAPALRIGAATIALVAVVAAVIAATSGGSASPNAAPRHDTTAANGIAELLSGIPQAGNTLGSPSAPVTVQYFGDLECSTSRAFTLNVLPSIIRNWVRPGKLRIEYRSFRTVSEPETFNTQQVAALAAGMQNKLWYYLENFYHEQGQEHTNYVTETYLQDLARQVPGLNLELWADDRHDPELTPKVVHDEQAAHEASLDSTPSLLIGRTGATPLHSFNQVSALGLAAVNEAVRQTLYSQLTHGRRITATDTQSNHL